MKICIIGPVYPYRGGISHYTTLLYHHLAKKHQVYILNFSRLYPSLLFPGKTPLDYSKTAFKVYSELLLDSINPITWVKTFHRVKILSPQLVIYQWWNPFFGPALGVISSLIHRFTRTKLLFICHNVIPHERRVVDHMFSRFALTHGDYFIVHSGEDLLNLKKWVPADRIIQTYLPSYEIFTFGQTDKQQAKQQLNIQDKIILFFGYVREYKGLEYLIKAFSKVLEKVKYVHLLIVGEFYENKTKYIKLITELGINDKTTIVDRYVRNEEVGYYFSAADVVVIPYVTATQSAIIQIAYGFNKPVITTNVGGLPEVIKNGVTGYTVPPQDYHRLADAIVRYFVENKEHEFTQNIIKNKNRFSWWNLIAVIEELLY